MPLPDEWSSPAKIAVWALGGCGLVTWGWLGGGFRAIWRHTPWGKPKLEMPPGGTAPSTSVANTVAQVFSPTVNVHVGGATPPAVPEAPAHESGSLSLGYVPDTGTLDVGPTIRDLLAARADLPGNADQAARPANCRLKVVKFLAALAVKTPYIRVEVEVTNFEPDPLRLFVLSVDTLHINRGPLLMHITQFAPDRIPATDHKQLGVSRDLTTNEIRALSEVPDLPAADAQASATALVNVRGRDSVAANGLNETVSGRIEGKPPYLLLTAEEWERRTATNIKDASPPAARLPASDAPHLTDEQRRAMGVFARENVSNGAEAAALAAYINVHPMRAQSALDELTARGLLERLPDSMGGAWVYVPTAAGRQYLIENRLT